MEADNHIAIRGLSKHYRGAPRPALSGVDLDIAPGEIFGVIGPNGAGKTTLFGCLLGLLQFEGQVHTGGLDPREPQARRHFGYVPERLTFEPWMKAAGFVGYHYDLSRSPAEGREAAVRRALNMLDVPEEDWGKQVRKFSRGNLQRLALAQAIVARPRFLFLDEPTSGMDPLGVLRFKELVLELAAQGCTVVFNSHQLNQVEDLCDRVALLHAGEVNAIKRLKRRALEKSQAYDFELQWLERPGAKERVRAVLQGQQTKGAVLRAGNARLRVENAEDAATLLALAVRAGIKVTQAGPARAGLEAEFDRLSKERA